MTDYERLMIIDAWFGVGINGMNFWKDTMTRVSGFDVRWCQEQFTRYQAMAIGWASR